MRIARFWMFSMALGKLVRWAGNIIFGEFDVIRRGSVVFAGQVWSLF